MILWLAFEKKTISILAGNLNSGRSYLITAVNNVSFPISRDVGIVIQISILQWVMEIIQNAFYLFYMYHLRGWSHTLDKFFTLYMMAFTIIVIPLFYLNGDIDFRYDLANYGYIRALKNAIWK